MTFILMGVLTALAAVTLTRSSRGTWLAGWLAAVLLGLGFAGAVADRFGVFGPPGSPGVSWGSWPAFIDYTARLLPGWSRPAVAEAAVTATAVEVVVAVLMMSGWQRRWVGKAVAGLLLVYLMAMGHALGAAAVAAYGLPVLLGGALLVSSCPPFRARNGSTPTCLPASQPEQT